MLIIAYPTMLSILYLYFKVYKKDFHVVIILASIDISKRVQIINRFCYRDDLLYYNMASNANILLITIVLVKIGLNLINLNVFI